jgi:hypothetical protein
LPTTLEKRRFFQFDRGESILAHRRAKLCCRIDIRSAPQFHDTSLALSSQASESLLRSQRFARRSAHRAARGYFLKIFHF